MKMGRILGIGELMMRLTPKHHVRLNQTNEFAAYFGGAEANVLMSLSKMGHATQFLSVLPSNDLGDAALSHLRSGGVDTKWVFRGGDRLGLYYYEEGYSIKQAKVIYDRSHSSVHHLKDIDINWVDIFKGVDILHLTGITPALSRDLKELTVEAMKQAKMNSVKVSFDFNFRSKLWTMSQAKEVYLELLPYIDICFAGYKDFFYLLNDGEYEDFDEERLAAYYEKYSKKYNIEVLASTNRHVVSASHNQLQAYFYHNGMFRKSKEYSIDILERIGGGDAFVAGILHGILMKKNDAEIAEFGMASGAVKHTVYGDYNQFTAEEIETFLSTGNGEVSR